MTKDEALKLALEALKHTHPSALTSFYTIGDRDKAIKAIQEHLAQPEQEPVKFEAVWDSGPTNKDYEDAMRLKRLQQLTTPPQRTWFGLELSEIEEIISRVESMDDSLFWMASKVEAKLKEKNT